MLSLCCNVVCCALSMYVVFINLLSLSLLTRKVYATIELQGKLTRGQMVIHWVDAAEAPQAGTKPPNVRLITKINKSVYADLIQTTVMHNFAAKWYTAADRWPSVNFHDNLPNNYFCLKMLMLIYRIFWQRYAKTHTTDRYSTMTQTTDRYSKMIDNFVGEFW